jgi:membrane protein
MEGSVSTGRRLTDGAASPATLPVPARDTLATEQQSGWRAFVGLLREAWIEFERDRAHYFAMAIIYYAGISIVPLLMLLFAALGLLLRFSATAGDIEQRVLLAVEGYFGSEVATTIHGLLDGVQRSSVTATFISVIGVIISASLLFRQLRLTFRAIWHYDPPLVAGPIHVRLLTLAREWLIAFVITLGGGGLLFLAVFIISGFEWIDRVLGRSPLIPPTAGLLAAASSFVLAAITFAALFKVLPPRTPRWRDIWLAVVLCAVAWVGATELMPLYQRFFGGHNNAFTVIGALLPLLISMNIASKMLFFGAELCKVVSRRATLVPADEGAPP